jgi:hypothetical protein
MTQQFSCDPAHTLITSLFADRAYNLVISSIDSCFLPASEAGGHGQILLGWPSLTCRGAIEGGLPTQFMSGTVRCIQPKSAFSCFPLVHTTDLEEHKRGRFGPFAAPSTNDR